MKNHFAIGYFGNKRKEVDEIYNNINLDGIKYIVEPFMGTSAMSYYISTKHPKKFTYILNDNNKHLIKLYEILKDDELVKSYETVLMDISKNLTKEQYDSYNNNTFIGWLLHNKLFQFRPGYYNEYRCKNKKVKLRCDIMKFLKEENVIFSNMDAVEVVKQYENKEAFIYLDPPYINTDNTAYKNPTFEIYDYLKNINVNNKRIILNIRKDEKIRKLYSNRDVKSYNVRMSGRHKYHIHDIYYF